MEVVRLENLGPYREDMFMPGDIFLLQVKLLCLYSYAKFKPYFCARLVLETDRTSDFFRFPALQWSR